MDQPRAPMSMKLVRDELAAIESALDPVQNSEREDIDFGTDPACLVYPMILKHVRDLAEEFGLMEERIALAIQNQQRTDTDLCGVPCSPDHAAVNGAYYDICMELVRDKMGEKFKAAGINCKPEIVVVLYQGRSTPALSLSPYTYESDTPFHFAGESYAGRDIPHMAADIHYRNKELAASPSTGLTRINLASIMIGNGLIDPRFQIPSAVEFACDGPYAIYDNPYGR
ncbi:hypothetical protein BJ138DRAFT_1123421 [Hygrophoropsis aurantiaca]|uniref:Uncharacterized protein n=1 Tax=Hygrophoropsis aurantiaca TaxID=72124 RepID=A0ACB8AMA2_9AGAM|nr:hypothetical protein BJ138DRAFT_1123421 [Hygrophoropsis aurantiaca]